MANILAVNIFRKTTHTRGLSKYIGYNKMIKLICLIKEILIRYISKERKDICHSIHCQEQNY